MEVTNKGNCSNDCWEPLNSIDFGFKKDYIIYHMGTFLPPWWAKWPNLVTMQLYAFTPAIKVLMVLKPFFADLFPPSRAKNWLKFCRHFHANQLAFKASLFIVQRTSTKNLKLGFGTNGFFWYQTDFTWKYHSIENSGVPLIS